MTDVQAEREMQRLDKIVRSAGYRMHKGAAGDRQGGVIDWNDPFEVLAAREEEALREATLDAMEFAQSLLEVVELPAPVAERIKEIVFDHFRQYEETFIEWLFAAGPHPLEVVRRLFAYVKKKRASLLWNMGFRKIGPLLRETHASAALRCKMLFGKTPTGWNKPASACEAMRQSALNNCNRRGGKKLQPGFHANHQHDTKP